MTQDNHVIQGLWIGTELSRLEQLSIKSFLANGHAYHLYTYGAVRHVPDGVVIKDANEIVPEGQKFTYNTGPGKGSYAGFANLFRYKLLLEKGSWWADLDMVCLKPFDFSEPYVFAAQRRQQEICVNNCCLKVPVGSELMRRCYELASQKDSSKLVWGETGPTLLNAEVERLKLGASVRPPEVFCPVDFRRFVELMEPGRPALGDASYAVHAWHEMWRRTMQEGGRFGVVSELWHRMKFNKNRRFSERTILGQLQRRYGVG